MVSRIQMILSVRTAKARLHSAIKIQKNRGPSTRFKAFPWMLVRLPGPGAQ